MIIVKLKGGLGNQMFQYACGRALAEKNKSSFFLDLTFLLYRPASADYTIRGYQLDAFNIQERFTFLSILNQRISHPTFFYKLNCKINSAKKRLKMIKLINEDSLDFDFTICDSEDSTYLDGYWQDEKYFKKIEEIIRKEFTIDSMSKEAIKIKMLIEKESNPVSVHIRRGDYVKNPKALAELNSCSLSYYEKAIDLVDEKTKNARMFIFSDDIEWAKKNIRFKNSFFVSNPKLGAVEDLVLMSSCKHNIIANSSFSWWGAWLNKNKEKIVISPRNWFLKQKDKDTTPSSWYRI